MRYIKLTADVPSSFVLIPQLRQCVAAAQAEAYGASDGVVAYAAGDDAASAAVDDVVGAGIGIDASNAGTVMA